MPPERHKRILLTSSVGVAQRFIQALVALIVLPVLIRHLGVPGFGVWGAATSLIWLTPFLDLGLGGALVALLPGALGVGDVGRARAYVGAVLLGEAGLAVLLLAGGGCWLFARGWQASDAPFLTAGAALALNVPLSAASRIWLSLQKGYVANAWDMVQALLLFGFVLVAVSRGAGVAGLVAATYAAYLAAGLASTIHLFLSQPDVRPRFPRDLAPVRQVAATGGLMFGDTAVSTASYAFDNVLALAWLGPAASAQMAIATRVCTTALGFLSSISVAFWPAFTEAAAQGDRQWIARNLRIGLLSVGGLAILGSAVLVSLGPTVFRLWLGDRLPISAALLWAAAAWIVFMSLPQIPSFVVISASRLSALIPLAALTTGAALALKFILAPSYGVIGIIVASPVSALIVALPGTLWIGHTWMAALPSADHPARRAFGWGRL